MPVVHDAAPAVTYVPLRCEVLIPCAKVLGIRGACSRSFAPYGRIARAQRPVRYNTDRLAQAFGADVPAPYVGEILMCVEPERRPALQICRDMADR